MKTGNRAFVAQQTGLHGDVTQSWHTIPILWVHAPTTSECYPTITALTGLPGLSTMRIGRLVGVSFSFV